MRHAVRVAATAAILLASAAGSFSAEGFIGTLAFTKPGCEATRDCILKNNFVYKAKNGLEWQADKGNLTDGASIPSLAQPFVGKPFDKDLIRAAVIHDHYCDRHVRSWWSTHRVFYDALLFSGVEIGRAKVMYSAVVVGGPKWITVIDGKPCGSGEICVNSLTRTATYSRGPQYDAPDFEAKIQPLAEKILANPSISLDDIDKEALALSPDDFFLTRGDTVVLEFGTPEYSQLRGLFEDVTPQRFENFRIQDK